jgi:hypothetical protein
VAAAGSVEAVALAVVRQRLASAVMFPTPGGGAAVRALERQAASLVAALGRRNVHPG